jgi:hypothetical protein
VRGRTWLLRALPETNFAGFPTGSPGRQIVHCRAFDAHDLFRELMTQDTSPDTPRAGRDVMRSLCTFFRGRPLGIWILALWSTAHAIAAMLAAPDASGTKGLVIWAVIVGEVALAFGLLKGWRPARYLLIAQVSAHVLVFGLFFWIAVFIAFAWGLRGGEPAIVLSIVAYLIFVCWAFMYLFHPDVEEFFASRLVHVESRDG